MPVSVAAFCALPFTLLTELPLFHQVRSALDICEELFKDTFWLSVISMTSTVLAPALRFAWSLSGVGVLECTYDSMTRYFLSGQNHDGTCDGVMYFLSHLYEIRQLVVRILDISG
jgi:hypothetical protein